MWYDMAILTRFHPGFSPSKMSHCGKKFHAFFGGPLPVE
jgi:hypothetical protein